MQTKETVCIGDARAWHHLLLWLKKEKKFKKPRPMIMVKERTAVKTAHKHCRMRLENILERKEKGSEILFKVTLTRSALTSVQNMSFQQHFSIKLG